MKLLRNLFICLLLAYTAHAQTPFVLTGVKSYYPVVELNTDKIDVSYKKRILDMVIEKSTELGVETKSFSTRSLAFLISYIGIDDTLALKVELMLGESAMRLDTKEEIFVLSYINTHIFVPYNPGEELLEHAEELLDIFAAQYKEDNL